MCEEKKALWTTVSTRSVWGRGFWQKLKKYSHGLGACGLRSKMSECIEQSNTKCKSQARILPNINESADCLLGTLSVSRRHPCAERKLMRRAVSSNRNQIISGWEAPDPEMA